MNSHELHKYRVCLDLPYAEKTDDLPPRLLEMHRQAEERIANMTTGGSVTAPMIEGICRQLDLERQLAAAGVPGFNLQDCLPPQRVEPKAAAPENKAIEDSELPVVELEEEESHGRKRRR